MKTQDKSNSELLDSFDESEFKVAIIRAEELKMNCKSYRLNGNFYIFIYAGSGRGVVSRDFQDVTINAGQAMIIEPNQMVGIESVTDNAEGWVIKFPADAVSESGLKNLSYLLIDNSPIDPSPNEKVELARLFTMLNNRGNSFTNPAKEDIARLMAYTFGCIIIEALANRTINKHRRKLKHIKLLTDLHKLFETELKISRLPSHYSQMLDITPSYLNEKFSKIFGTNISRYIRRESILRSARMLASTDLSVKEVARQNGYEDPAYYTRLFTKMTGMNPTAFRHRYHS